MKIAQVRAYYYSEFLRITVMLLMHMTLAKYDAHALIRNGTLIFRLKFKIIISPNLVNFH